MESGIVPAAGHALRGDEALTKADLRELMQAYISCRRQAASNTPAAA